MNNTCVNISELDDKYFKDKNSSEYKLCKEGVENCELCKSENECIKCFDNYTKVNSINSSCHNISELSDEYYLDPEDPYNYKSCSYLIENCKNCNSSQCFLCEEGYIFINDDFQKCHLKSSIDLSDYFTNDNKTYYSCKEEKYKNAPQCINPSITSIPTFIITTIPSVPTSEITNIPQSDTTIISSLPVSTTNDISTVPSSKFTNIPTIETTSINPTSEIITTSKISNIPTTEIDEPYSTIITSIIQTDIISDRKNTETESISDIINSEDIIPITTPLPPSKNPYPFPSGINSLFFLQAQIINGKVIIFLVADFMIKDLYYFDITIIVYYSSYLRNLNEEKKNITVGLDPKYITKDENEIVCLSSEDLKNDIDLKKIKGVKIENIIPLNNNTKSSFNINLKNNKKYLDTQNSEQLIKNGEIDFNQIVGKRPDYKVNLYKIESIPVSNQCGLDLNISKSIEYNNEFNLTFTNEKNTSDTYITNCANNQGKIKCKLDKQIDSNYKLEDYLEYDNNALTVIYLPKKNEDINLVCNSNYRVAIISSPKNSKLMLLIIVIAASILLIVLITLIICCCRKRKRNKNKIYNNNNENYNNYNNTDSNIIQGNSSNVNPLN